MRFLREILTRLQLVDLQHQHQQLQNELSNSSGGGGVSGPSSSSSSQSHMSLAASTSLINMASMKLSLESFMNVENLSLVFLPIINSSYLTEFKLRCLWSFATRLVRAMLDQNLLDKQFVLESLLDLLEKSVANGLAVGGVNVPTIIPGGGAAAGSAGGSRSMNSSSAAAVAAAAAAAANASNTASSFETHSCKLILTTGICF